MGNKASTSDSDIENQRSFWDILRDSDDSDCSDSSSGRRRRRSPSPPPKKPRVELKYDDNDDDEDDTDDDTEIKRVTYLECGSTLNIKYCTWTIYNFSNCDVHKEKGTIRSNVYVAGVNNQFQFYFIMEKLVGKDDTYFGVYVNVLSNIRSEATVNYKSYVIELRGHKYQLASSRAQAFPRKAGFKFLGSLMGCHVLDEDYWAFRYVPEDELTLCFKINVQYTKIQSPNNLRTLFENNQVKDVTLIVKGKEFPANKKILSERSSTFAKLLMKNGKAKKLEISDVEPDVMKQLLLYIYTGKVNKLFTYADKLSEAADKYKLKELKAICKKVKS